MKCPKCNSELKDADINGLYFVCSSCGFLDDSTFDMIMEHAEKVKQ